MKPTYLPTYYVLPRYLGRTDETVMVTIKMCYRVLEMSKFRTIQSLRMIVIYFTSVLYSRGDGLEAAVVEVSPRRADVRRSCVLVGRGSTGIGARRRRRCIRPLRRLRSRARNVRWQIIIIIIILLSAVCRRRRRRSYRLRNGH